MKCHSLFKLSFSIMSLRTLGATSVFLHLIISAAAPTGGFSLYDMLH